MRRIAVIMSSVRSQRFADRPARWVMRRLAAESDVEPDLIDLRDHVLPGFDQVAPLHTGRSYPTEDIARFARRIDDADGFVVLTSEYNHGYTGVLKNAMDHTFVEWNRKPISFVAWGNVGGARAVEQLRTVAVEFDMAPLRAAVHILPDLLYPAIRAAAPFDLAMFSPLEPKLDALVTELLWWTDALKAQRAKSSR
ncbi:MAG: NAD(P)H-dependent oxidoreductase [Mycobacterium sp.]|nr:NAD(P)H-dependent oxidoreductase [Mycobacterium sp.]